ncbi:HigA family addiction module antitoxin [Enorma sp.]|nr:HigA family addiction module antitoxin [uncultured Enorma sp.]
MSKSSTSITVSDDVVALAPVTPGELLKEEFLEPLGISQCRLAKEAGIPAQRIGRIVLGRRSVTADTDLRLCRFSACPMVIGCARRRLMISRLRVVNSSPS